MKSKNTFKKSWKQYLLDFLMLFLAVTLGFFADSLREKKSERAKEKAYIVSMIEDAKTDKENIRKSISANQTRIKHLDSLSNLCVNYTNTNNDVKLYQHYHHGLVHPDVISPTERTIQQLNNAGGMRLIENKTVVGLIIAYNDQAKKLYAQQKFYEHYQNKSIDKAVQLFNFNLFNFKTARKNIKKKNPPLLLKKDKSEIIEFGNVVLIYEGVVIYYTELLKQMHVKADELISVLEKEYEIE